MGSSKELITRTRDGDRCSMEALLLQHVPGLRAFVRMRAGGLLRAREESSDLVQSVCREVLADLSEFEYRGEAAFRCWLYEAALRKILDRQRYWRAAKRDARDMDVHGSESAADNQLLAAYASILTPSAQVQAHEEIARLEAAFDSLPPHYREVISLARVVGLSQAEIATRMGRSEDAVRNLLARALARLSSMLTV